MRRVAVVGAGMTPFAEHFALGVRDLVPMAFADCAASVDKARALMPGAPIASSAIEAMAGADVVYLACPPGPRKAYALAAAAAGQGVFMEKPLGTDEAASRDLVARLKQGRLGAVVNFTVSTMAMLYSSESLSYTCSTL